MKNHDAPAKNTREALLKQYASARTNLLLMTGLSVVNIIFLLTGSETMLLFSATIPYMSVIIAMDEPEMLIPGIVVAAVCILLYLLCWFMSKKHYQWFIVAAVLFAVDCAFLAWLYISVGEISGILDAVFHAYVIYYIGIGIIDGNKLRQMNKNGALGEGIAEESFNPAQEISEIAENPYKDHNSVYKRRADTDVKSRTLAEGVHNGHHICYRRVKRTNELVIDGYVYDEIEMLIETPHMLTAVIEGELVRAGMRNNSRSYITVDGKEIANKLRLF